MALRHFAAATAVAATLGIGFASAQTAQQVNPSPMPPGSPANQAPGMGSDGVGNVPGTSAQQVNPTPMPPGSQANQAPGMNPAQRGTPDRGVVGGQGAMAPSGQPDVQRGTAPMTPGTGVAAPATPMAPPPAATGATAPNMPATGGVRSDARPGAPVEGRNSFTEGQARSRISDAGYTDVQGLRLDDQGVWRGQAMRGGERVTVGLDFQGNVVVTR